MPAVGHTHNGVDQAQQNQDEEDQGTMCRRGPRKAAKAQQEAAKLVHNLQNQLRIENKLPSPLVFHMDNCSENKPYNPFL